MSSMASVSSTRCSTASAVEAHVQGPERDLVAHRRREHLGVGVLEDEPDAAAERPRELLVLEVVLGDRRRRTRGSVPASGKSRPSSTLSSVDFPQPLAPSSATLLARVDRQTRRRRARGSARGRSSARSAALQERRGPRLSRGHGHPTPGRGRWRQQATAPRQVAPPRARSGGQQPDVAGVAACHHRQVHLLRERVRLAEECPAPTPRRTLRPVRQVAVGADGARTAGGVHVGRPR